MASRPSLLSKTFSVLVSGFVVLNCFAVDKFGSHAQGITPLLPLDEVLRMASPPSLLSKTFSVLVSGFVVLNCFAVDKFGSHAQVITPLLPLDEEIDAS
ncbi:hypothetical protein POTOM_002971 [Populus tomentosa]|uniref:Uncharacterized protein n=1 Tax=Populus tomentosa TaxID=118781 RepID=A0A8X8DKN0_POPTO|nr:hypothetical protein POTOM_002971 [Populus tomentosa]